MQSEDCRRTRPRVELANGTKHSNIRNHGNVRGFFYLCSSSFRILFVRNNESSVANDAFSLYDFGAFSHRTIW